MNLTTTAAVLETVHRYRGVSATPLDYLQRTLQAADIPAATLLSQILYSRQELDTRTFDSIAACIFGIPVTRIEVAIQAAVTSRPAQLGEGNEPVYVELFRRCIHLGQGPSDYGQKLLIDVLEALGQATINNTAGIREAAQTALRDWVGSDPTTSDVVIHAIRKIAGGYTAGQNTEDNMKTAAVQGLDDVRSATPDPLTETLVHGSTNTKAYTHIKTPVYVTYALQNALEQTWTWQSSRRPDPTSGEGLNEGEEDIRNLPTAFRDLIHLGPILTSNPSTFAHFLLQASFERVFSSLRDLRQGAKRDAQMSVKPEDQIMVDLSNGTEPSERDRIATRIVKVGWNEIIWLFHNLAASLRFWKWSSAEGRAGSDWHQDWPYPVCLVAYADPYDVLIFIIRIQSVSRLGS